MPEQNGHKCRNKTASTSGTKWPQMPEKYNILIARIFLEHPTTTLKPWLAIGYTPTLATAPPDFCKHKWRESGQNTNQPKSTKG
ncbi:hypothetical protein [Hallella sp.]|uniref:hypothetical protein n=1 Tax=Hallella sp. TaxID=2980186 RepID=UPI00307928A5